MVNKTNNYFVFMNLSNRIVIYICGLIPILYQFILTKGLSSIFMYIPYLLLLVIGCINYNKVKVNRRIISVSSIFIISYYIIPLIMYLININRYMINIKYIFLFLIFIIALIIIVSILNKDDYCKLVETLLIGNTIGLVYQIIINFNELNISNILSFFNGNREMRAYYGFPHPNIAAIFIVIEIILIYIYFFRIIKAKYIFSIIAIIIFEVCVLATASRTAEYMLIIFSCLELVSFIINKFNKKNKRIISICIIIPIIMVYIVNFNFENLFIKSSGRNIAIINNIKVLIRDNRIITGYGAIPVTDIAVLLPQIYMTDTWYITHIITFGFISLIFIILLLSYLMVYFYRKNSPSYTINLLIFIILYSLSENVMFVPGNILTPIIWIILYCNLSINKECGRMK